MTKVRRNARPLAVIAVTVAAVLFLSRWDTRAADQTPFRFVAWGDTKTATSVLSSLSDQALPLNPAFTIYAGDLENSGFTQNGMDAWRNAINGQLTGGSTSNGMFDRTFPVRGNHDSSNTSGWQAYFNDAATAARVGATNYQFMAGNDDLVYSFDYRNSRFIGLDALGNVQTLSSAQIAWMDARLADAEAAGLTHAFLLWHGPIYCLAEHCSATSRTDVSEGDRGPVINVINKHPIVTASFHGHEHVYTHTRLDSTRIPALTHPFDQFVVGDAGAGPDVCDPGRFDFCMQAHGFVTVDVNGSTVTVTFYRQGDTTPQKVVTIQKGGAPAPGDTTPPTASITAPAAGATVSGTATISANASDNVGVTRVEFYRGGTTLIGSDTTSPFSVSWNTTTAPNGSQSLTARAFDAAGNSGNSAAVSVTVNNVAAPPADTSPPTASITAPAAGATVSNTVTVSANASDNVGVTRVEFLVDGSMIGSDTSSPFSASWNTTAATNGSHSLTARAFDAAGNTGTSPAVSVSVNNVAAPPGGGTPFRFVAWADTKTATSVLSGLSDQAVTFNPALTIYPGDLENSGFTQSGMDAWRNAINGQLTGGSTSNGMFDRTFPVRGNHDSSNTSGWQAYFNMAATAARVGATNYQFMSGNDDLVYSFDYRNSRFIGLDALGNAQTLSSAQVAWLDARLADAEAAGLTHAFIYFHGPIYCLAEHCSATSRTDVSEGDRGPVINVINKHPIVTASFHGHEHVFAHTRLDNTRIPALTHPFDQFVVGDAGAGPDTCDAGRFDFCMQAHGFTTVDVNGSTVTVTFYRQGDTTPQKVVTIQKGGVPAPGDTTPPTASITSPSAGATVSGTVTISATASDNVGVTRVEFRDGSTTIGEDTTAPYSFSWNTTTTTNGSHSLTARSFDAAGNSGTSPGVSVTVNNVVVPPADTSPPTASITAPASGATVSGMVTISATASDNVGVTRVEFRDGSTTIGEDTTAPYSFSWNTTSASNGSHSLTARAFDAAGNSGTSPGVSVNVNNVAPGPSDTTPPTASITAPTANATVSGTTTISATASDNVAVTRVDFYRDGSTLLGSDTSSPYSFSWNTTSASNGPHSLTARAFDAAGNSGTSPAVSVTVTNGGTPPQPPPGGRIRAKAETHSSRNFGDTEDSVIWVHPTDRSLSLIIGDAIDDGEGGLVVWDLAGNEVQRIESETEHYRLDLRYNFPLAGHFGDGTAHTSVDLIAVAMDHDQIGFYKVNPATRRVEFINSQETDEDDLDDPFGACLYRSQATGKYYFFAVAEDDGDVQQYELYDAGDGEVGMKPVRSFDVGGDTENCAVDDQLGFAYFAEEDNGNIWKYQAEPDTGSKRIQVDKSTEHDGHIKPDVEGLAVYHAGPDRGYLIAAHDEGDEFLVYRLEGNNEFLGSFTIDGNGSVDEVSGTIGIAVSNLPLGPEYPNGLFVASDHDDHDGESHSNHKFVPWDWIATTLGLVIDTTWDPRSPGATPPPAPQVTLSSLAITGPASVAESSTANYTATATFSDSTTQNVTTSATWSENSNFASISNTGVLTATAVTGNQPVMVSASYTSGSVTRTATLPVTIQDAAPAVTLTSLAITGPATVAEGGTASYTATATFSDSTTQNVTTSATWSENSSFASISSAGVLTATAVTGNQPVTVSAAYTSGSVTRTATLPVTIQDAAPAVTLTSLAITGPATVAEGGTASYTATATFSNSTTQNVTASATWSENSSFASISNAGVLTATAVTGNQPVTVSASYTSGGVTRNASLPVTIQDSAPAVTLISLAIAGPARVSESSTRNYTATATFSNGTSQSLTTAATWSENSNFASVSGGALTSTSVTGNQNLTLSASYTSGGVTRNAMLNVQIVDNSEVCSRCHSFRTASPSSIHTVGSHASFSCTTCHTQ